MEKGTNGTNSSPSTDHSLWSKQFNLVKLGKSGSAARGGGSRTNFATDQRTSLCLRPRPPKLLSSLLFLPEGLLCSRDIDWVKEKDVWIVSVSVRLCLCLCVVGFWLKEVISDFWCAYIRCKFQETGSSWLKFKNPNCAQFGFLKFGTIQVFKFQTIHRIIETQ